MRHRIVDPIADGGILLKCMKDTKMDNNGGGGIGIFGYIIMLIFLIIIIVAILDGLNNITPSNNLFLIRTFDGSNYVIPNKSAGQSNGYPLTLISTSTTPIPAEAYFTSERVFNGGNPTTVPTYVIANPNTSAVLFYTGLVPGSSVLVGSSAGSSGFTWTLASGSERAVLIQAVGTTPANLSLKVTSSGGALVTTTDTTTQYYIVNVIVT